MKVLNEITPYEVNGEERKVGDLTSMLKVSSVWNKNKVVELQIGNGIRIVVGASELKKAIDNATNNELH